MFHGWHHLGSEGEQIIEEAVINDTVPAGPFHLELQPTNVCNARCGFCTSVQFRSNEVYAWPALERLLRQEAERNLRFVRLIGGGEPLLYPQFGALLGTLRDSAVRGCDITTNGVLLDRYAEGLAEARCESVHLSLNEATEDRYVATMGTPAATFHRVLAGARRVAEVRDAAAPGMKLTVQFFINEFNWRDVRRMYDLGLDLGADWIDLRSVFVPPSGAEIHAIPEASLPAFEALIRPIVEEDLRQERSRVRVSLYSQPALNHELNRLQAAALPAGDPRLYEFRESNPRREYCYMPWYSAVIAATGRVFSCCHHTESPEKCLGQVGEDGFGPVWHGPQFAEYRRQMRELMLLRGRMKYSPKCHCYLSKQCTENFGCNITFQLASESFYDRLLARMEAEFTPFDRAQARFRDAAVRTVHRTRAIVGGR